VLPMSTGRAVHRMPDVGGVRRGAVGGTERRRRRRVKPDELAGFPQAILDSDLYRGATWRFPAAVKYVVDGDTADYMFDKGMYDYPWHRIRHAGYDAPERYRGTLDERSRGAEARSFLRDVVYGFDADIPAFANGKVGIITLKPDFDASMDRWVGEIIVMWEGAPKLLSELMIETGHVKIEGDTSWGG
jgi:hypothetical protein